MQSSKADPPLTTVPPTITLGTLWRQYLPLSISDVTMAAAEPLVATTLAHLPDARVSLAALGIAKSIAIFLESPIIMVLHASHALAASVAAHRALRRFVQAACVALTLAMAIILLPPVYELVVRRLLGIGPLVAHQPGNGWPSSTARILAMASTFDQSRSGREAPTFLRTLRRIK
jgi:hypothetical protein